MQRLITFLVFLVAACITTVSAYAASQYMLMLSPLRIILDDRHRAEKMTVVNLSEEKVNYSISTVTMRRNKDGKETVVTDETEKEKMIRKMIRLSPRRATIGPKERQIIKLMVRKPKDLPPGEYRTFLQLTPVPIENKDKKEDSGEGFKIELDMIVSSRFPIIIQHKLPPAEVTPTGLVIQKTEEHRSVALVTLSREGQLSSFGNWYLFYVPENSSQQTKRVGLVQGIAIYQPQKKKKFKVGLKDITEQELKSGSIRVQYIPSRGVAEKRPGKKQTMTWDFPLGS